MASVIALAAFRPAFCASQKMASPRTTGLVSLRATLVSVSTASASRLSDTANTRCFRRVSTVEASRRALRTRSNPGRPLEFAAQNAACLRVPIGLSGAISVASARSAAGSRCAAIASIAPSRDAVAPVAVRHGTAGQSQQQVDAGRRAHPASASRRVAPPASSLAGLRVGANALDLPVLDPIQHHGLVRRLELNRAARSATGRDGRAARPALVEEAPAAAGRSFATRVVAARVPLRVLGGHRVPDPDGSRRVRQASGTCRPGPRRAATRSARCGCSTAPTRWTRARPGSRPGSGSVSSRHLGQMLVAAPPT